MQHLFHNNKHTYSRVPPIEYFSTSSVIIAQVFSYNEIIIKTSI